MEEYRKEAIRNVRRTRGKINLDDLIARNNREFAEQKLSEKGSVSNAIIDEYTADEGSISDANLRMLVNEVTVHQNEDKSIDVQFDMNGDFTNSTMIILEPMFEEVF